MQAIEEEGREFVAADPEEVIDFLRSRSVRKVCATPENLHVVNDGTRLYLHHSQNGLREYPVRKAFALKLLRWFNFPTRLLGKFEIETVTMILNDILLNISSGDVTVTVEDGEALTVTSSRYSEVSDLEVLACCTSIGVKRVSRNDYFMRVYSSTRCEVEPEPGDICAFSYNVINSETGFRALTLSHYILRYICSNGAAVPVEGLHRIPHYGRGQGELFGLLQRHLAGGEKMRGKIIGALTESVRKPLDEDLTRITQSVDRLLGRGTGDSLIRHLPANPTRYDLFNELTGRAKGYPIGIRLQLEMIAGGLLN